MKLLFFSDLHLGTGVFKGRSGRQAMLDLGCMILTQVLQKARDLNAKVMFGGDWFDQPLNVNIEALNASIEILNRFSDIEIFAISGNHDLCTKAVFDPDDDGDYRYPKTALWPLAQACSNFKLMDNEKFATNFNRTYWFVPYFNSGWDFNNYLDWILHCYQDSSMTRNILIMHQTPQGNALNLPADVDMDGYKFDWVMCGHIHKPSQFGNLIVMGNPYQRDAGDFGQGKFIYLYDTETNDFEPIQLDYPKVVQSVASLQEIVLPKETEVAEPEIYQGNDKIQILAEYCKDETLIEYIKTYLQ